MSKKNAFILFYCLVLAVSLAYSELFVDAVLTSKTFWFYLFTSLFLVYFFITEIINRKKLQFRANVIDLGLILFYFYSLIRLLATTGQSLDNYNFISQTFLVLIYFVLRRVMSEVQDRHTFTSRILLGLFIICGIQVILGFIQYASYLQDMTKGFGITGMYSNPGPFSNYIVSVFPLTLVFIYAKNDNKFLRIVSTFLALIILCILPFTEARASWLAALAGVGFVLVAQYKLLAKMKAVLNTIFKRALVVICCLSIGIGLSYSLYHYKKDSAQGRLFIWEQSLEIIKTHPLFGVGYDRFSINYPDYQATYFKNNPTDQQASYLAGDIAHAFNEFIELAAEMGIVGLLLFLIFIFLLFRTYLQTDISAKENPLITGAVGSIVAILVAALFSYPFQSNALMLNFYLCAAIISCPVAPVTKLNIIKIPRLVVRIVAVLSIILLFVFASIQYKRIFSEKEWLVAVKNVQSGIWQPDEYEKLYVFMQYNPSFLFNYGAELCAHYDYQTSIEVLNEAKKYINNSDIYSYLGTSYDGINDLLNAEVCFLHATYLVPHKFYPKYKLAIIYQKTGRNAQAIRMAKKIIAMEVKVDSPLVREIKAEMNILLKAVGQ